MFVWLFFILLGNANAERTSNIELLRSELKDVKTSLLKEISGLKSEMRLQEKLFNNHLQTQALEIIQLRKIITEENTTSNKRMLLPTGSESSAHRVAFYTHLTKDQDNLGIHQPIIFDTIRYNKGNGYNSVSGVFGVPVNGTYFFIWTTSNSDGTSMQSELVVNGIVFGQIISDAANHGDWASSTAFAIVSLNVGNHVWIRTGTVHNLHHISGEGYGTSSFAGFLLW